MSEAVGLALAIAAIAAGVSWVYVSETQAKVECVKIGGEWHVERSSNGHPDAEYCRKVKP